MHYLAEQSLLPLSQAEQMILFTVSKLGTMFTYGDIEQRLKQHFHSQLRDQAILVNFRTLRSRGLVDEIGHRHGDARIKLYCTSLRGLFLVITVSEAIRMDEKNFSMTDIRHRRGVVFDE